MAQKNIHPKYFSDAKVKCSCGNEFSVGATKEIIETEVCSQCHPFFSGGNRIVDAMGQVQKFKKRLEKYSSIKETKKKSKKK